MSFTRPPYLSTSDGADIVVAYEIVDTDTPQNLATSCALIPGDPGSGITECGLPTTYNASHTFSLADIAEAARLDGDGQAKWFTFQIKVSATGPGYATYGCRRADHPDDLGTVDGCAVQNTDDISTELSVSGIWMDNGYVESPVFGNDPGTGAQNDVSYQTFFGYDHISDPDDGAYLLNPSPTWPTPDELGNTFGEVMFHVDHLPDDITVSLASRGAHSSSAFVTILCEALRSDRHGSTTSHSLMCVL